MKRFIPVAALSALLVACGGVPVESDTLGGGGGGAGSVVADPADCTFDHTDDLEPRMRLPKGPHKGRCIDTTKARAVKNVGTSHAALFSDVRQGDTFVANFFHDSRFWIAKIPMNAVERFVFQIEYFPAAVPAAHTQLRAEFSTPVELVSQSGEQVRTSVKNIIMSIEAVGHPGYKYDLVSGVLDHFGLVYRMTSLDVKMDWMILTQKHKVDQLQLNLTKAEMAAYLRDYISTSESKGYQHMYNTLLANCTNELVRGFDRTVNYSLKEKALKIFTQVNEVYPVIVKEALASRGLLFDRNVNVLPDLENDSTAADVLQRLKDRRK